MKKTYAAVQALKPSVSSCRFFMQKSSWKNAKEYYKSKAEPGFAPFTFWTCILVWCPSKQAEQHNNSASCCANLDRIAEEGPFLCPLQPQPFWPFWNSIQRIVLQNAPDNASKRLQPYTYLNMHIHLILTYIDVHQIYTYWLHHHKSI